MLMNRLKFFETLYFEELEIIEDEMKEDPNNPEYIEQWISVAGVLNKIRKERGLQF